MRFRYSKKDKIKSKKQIDLLFKTGKSIIVYPLLLKYLKSNFKDDVSLKASVSVSKKRFRLAVDRNRINRLLKEAYRINKPMFFNNLTSQYAIMILYIGRDLPTFKYVNERMKKLMQHFIKNNS